MLTSYYLGRNVVLYDLVLGEARQKGTSIKVCQLKSYKLNLLLNGLRAK